MSALTSFRFCALLLVCELSYALWSERRDQSPLIDGFLVGDCRYYAAAAESLVRDGDWDLSNQLPGNLKNHEGYFAVSTDNRVVLKHSTLLPLLSAPLFMLLGVKGLLFFNLLQVFLLVLGIAFLAGNSPSARLLALAAYLSTPLLAYTYNFSPDVLGTLLMIWAFVCAAHGRPALAGLLGGLAVWAKIYLAPIVLPLGLIIIPRGWRATLWVGIAGAAAVTPMLLINWHLFGAPWITGYDRDARLIAGGYRFTEHYSRFNQPIVAGLGNLLFDERIGLLRTAPLWFLWPFGLAQALRRRLTTRLALAAMTMALVINLLIFARYDEWDASSSGNRFLFPALALGFVLQSSLWERICSGGRAGHAV